MSASLTFVNSQGQLAQPKAELQMSGSNTCAFLAALGLPTNFEEHSWTLAEFQEALRLFSTSEIGSLVDVGTPTVEDSSGSCTVIHCGRPPNYIASRVARATGMVAIAAQLGAVKCYFA